MEGRNNIPPLVPLNFSFYICSNCIRHLEKLPPVPGENQGRGSQCSGGRPRPLGRVALPGVGKKVWESLSIIFPRVTE